MHRTADGGMSRMGAVIRKVLRRADVPPATVSVSIDNGKSHSGTARIMSSSAMSESKLDFYSRYQLSFYRRRAQKRDRILGVSLFMVRTL